MAEISPAQVLGQMFVVKDHILKSMAFCSHQKGAGSPLSPEEIAVPLFQREQPIDGRSDLAAHIPIIQRRGGRNNIAFFHRRINFVHIIFLDAGTFPAAMSAETAFTAMNIHAVEEKFRHSVAGAFRTFPE